MNLVFEFTVNKASNSISVHREFNAEISLVWEAFTKSEILEQWWAPKPWKAKTKSMDFKEGGHWHYVMCGPAGERHWAYTTYEKIVLLKVFTGIDCFADENAVINKELPQSNWDVSFTDKGETTYVTTQISYESLEQLETTIKMGFKKGYTLAMESLDEFLIKQKREGTNTTNA